jgi:proteasome lid subunit RPN8/RPN11
MMQVSRTTWERIRRHLERGYPYEHCGILVGRVEDGAVIVEEMREARNLVTDRAADRYEIDPRDQLAVERQLCADGRSVVGYYHSHPDHPARPSETDIRLAWPATVYVIASIEKGALVAATAWRLADGDEKRFEEVALRIVG